MSISRWCKAASSDGLATSTSSLMSLGSVFYMPVVVFYRGTGLTQLSQLEGKRIAIGREGSGTRMLALKLLEANGIEPGGDTTLVPPTACKPRRNSSRAKSTRRS